MKAELDRSGTWRGSIVTAVVEAPDFYPAEEYHQQYLEKMRRQTGSEGVGCGTDSCGLPPDKKK